MRALVVDGPPAAGLDLVPDVIVLTAADQYAAAVHLSWAAHAPLAWAGQGPPPGPVHATTPWPLAGDALRRLALTPFTPHP